jgi:D-glycero-alpha-D-manno-heptose-7-phosphate kinase
MKIVAQAPCRISLAGGGTDVDPFAFTYGGQVLNFAIDLCHTATLIPLSDREIRLEALGEVRAFPLPKEPLPYGRDKKFDLIRAVINHFLKDIHSGFSLQIASPLISPLGLGRSGSVAVAAIGVFDAWLKTNMSRLEIGLLGSHLEVKELGWHGGKQDPLVAAFGGINVMTFGTGDDVRVDAVSLPERTLRALREQMFMVYIAGNRHSSDQQKQLIKALSDQEKLVAMMSLKNAVPAFVSALKTEDWPMLGKMFYQAWEDKKKSNPNVTNESIDALYALALDCGAYGGKVCGSGGAGSMFFLIPPKKKSDAIEKLVEAGAQLVDFNLDFKGLTIHVV